MSHDKTTDEYSVYTFADLNGVNEVFVYQINLFKTGQKQPSITEETLLKPKEPCPPCEDSGGAGEMDHKSAELGCL